MENPVAMDTQSILTNTNTQFQYNVESGAVSIDSDAFRSLPIGKQLLFIWMIESKLLEVPQDSSYPSFAAFIDTLSFSGDYEQSRELGAKHSILRTV